MEIISDLTRIAPVPSKRLRGGSPVIPGSSPSATRLLVSEPARPASVTGPDCHCKRYECFKVITPNERKQLIKQFDDIGREGGKNAQTMYLSALINRHTIRQGNRRGARNAIGNKTPDVYFRYKVIVIKDGSPVQVPVCFKAFFALFGITPAKVDSIKLGLAPKSKSSDSGNEKQPTLSEATRQNLQDFFTVQCGKAKAAGRGVNEERRVKVLLELFLHDHMGLQMGYETFRKAYQSWAWNAAVSRMRSDVEVISDDETEAPAAVATRPADSSSGKEVEFKPEMWEEESTSLAELKREPESETVVKKEDDPDLVIISDGEGEEKKEHDQTNKPKQVTTDKKQGIVTCCALACPNTSETFSMQPFPAFPTSLRRQWINRIDRLDWLPDKNSALCELHFDEEMWEPVSGGEQRLKPDAMPTLFLHGEAIKSWVTLDTNTDQNNGTSNLDAESQDSVSVYSDEPVEIKQEALEPEIDMVEGQGTIDDDDEDEDETSGHFETIYCDSTYDGLEETEDDPTGQNERLIVKDPGQDGYLLANPMAQKGGDRGKIIVLNKDQLNRMKPTLKRRINGLKQYQCPICDKELSRRKNLELHIQKLHKHVSPDEMEEIVKESCEGRKNDHKKKKLYNESLPRESTKSNTANGEVSKIDAKVNPEVKLESKAPPPLMPLVPFTPPLTPTTSSLFPAPRVTAPTFVMAEATSKANTEEKKQYVLVLQPPPQPLAPPCEIDDVFTVSLANVPQEKRDTLREKLRELVTAVAVKDLDPHRIIIAYDRT